MPPLPALFVSHGAPTMALEDGPARRFLRDLGRAVTATAGGKPRAVLVMSAHFDARKATVTSGAAPTTVHDFGGFPEALYQLRYPAPGAPDVAREAITLLRGAGFDAAADEARGYDHGTWVPLSLLYPAADVPVVQLSINMAETAQWHHDVGRALAGLRRTGVLVVGSGNLTHNLGAFFQGGFGPDAPAPDWVTGFSDWMAERVAAMDTAAILDAVEAAPHGRQNHPTADHILPLFFALGAGGAVAAGKRLHHSVTYGVLAMDAYGFGAAAAIDRLAAA